jgi:hypothetical protein
MRLNPPKKVTFWVSIFAFVIGTVLSLGAIPGAPVLMLVGAILSMLAFLLLVLGLIVKGL